MSLAYDTYLNEHIANVQKAETWMYDNLDLGQPEWSGRYSMNHDDSKYSVEEYDPYDQYFYGQNKTWKVCQDFDRAWLHHIHHNPHHWQHWVLIEDDPVPGTGELFNEAYREQVITVLSYPENYTEDEVHHAMTAAIEFMSRKPFKPLEMPKEYVIEMIADWWSFSWKNGNLYEIFDWYAEHKDKQYMHPKTRLLVEDLLLQIKMKLDAERELNGEEIPVTAWPPQIAPFSSVENYILHSDLNHEDTMGQLCECGHPNVLTVREMESLVKHLDSEPIGKVVGTRETENGLEVTVEHSEPEDDEDLYGVPELKKFPMPDKKHVKSAIRFFNYVDPKYEKELAEAIIEKAKEFGLDLENDISVGDENRFGKYLKKEES